MRRPLSEHTVVVAASVHQRLLELSALPHSFIKTEEGEEGAAAGSEEVEEAEDEEEIAAPWQGINAMPVSAVKQPISMFAVSLSASSICALRPESIR